VRADGAGQGPGLGPAAFGGVAGVLDAHAGEPIMAGQGKAADLRRAVWRYGRPIAGPSGWQACWLRSSLRVCPGLAGRGAWGGRSAGRAGPITFSFRPRDAAGNTRPGGRAPGRAGSSCCRCCGAAEAPVAQGIEDPGEQDPGGGGLGDAARACAAAGGDRVLDLPRPGAGGLMLDGVTGAWLR